jgi:hypothetical protein
LVQFSFTTHFLVCVARMYRYEYLGKKKWLQYGYKIGGEGAVITPIRYRYID